MISLDEIAMKLSARGFRYDYNSNYSEHGLFYKQITTKRPCLMNNRDQLCIGCWTLGQSYSFSVSITGQIPIADRWSKLEIYGIDADELLSRLVDFEAALIRAWEALS